MDNNENNASKQELIWKSEDILSYHQRQIQEPYRSTVHLIDFMRSLILDHKGEAIDVACGTGVNINYISRKFPNYRWTGIDYAGDKLFDMSRECLQNSGIKVNLIEGDMYKLKEIFPGLKFNLVLSIQTLSWIPSYEVALEQLLSITGGWLFVTSLFTDFEMDTRIEVIDFSRPDDVQEPQYYNVYSLSRFKKYCEERGCQQFVSQDFEIDIDLPQDHTGRGTYTQKLAGGKRLQFTGPIHLPWKFIGIFMGEELT